MSRNDAIKLVVYTFIVCVLTALVWYALLGQR